MKPEENGIGVLDITDFGPYKLWTADKWKCPLCLHEVIVGFGKEAITEHFYKSFDNTVNGYREQGKLIECKV